jgi:hypothetical protein
MKAIHGGKTKNDKIDSNKIYANTQYNLPAFVKKIFRGYNRDGIAERFEDPEVRKSVEADLAIIDSLNEILKKLK